MLVGFLWGVQRIAQRRFSPLEWRPATWVDGKAGRQLNQAIGRLPGQEAVDRWAAAFRYRVLGDLGAGVREGCPGWLFYQNGLTPAPAQDDPLSARLRLMREWAAQLKQANVRLLVVTVPDKSQIETAHLCGLQQAPTMAVRWRVWQEALRVAGIASVDPRGELAALPQAFYRTDVHLSPAGAQTVADLVAKRALVWLGNRGNQPFEHSMGHTAEPRMGDLVVLSGLDAVDEAWRPPLELLRPERIEPVRTGGLLDAAPPAQVLLLGDSNGLRSEFAGRLGERLGREVWNQSQDGGYFAGAMLAALERQQAWPSSVNTVIWQFSELALSLPLTAAETRAVQAIR